MYHRKDFFYCLFCFLLTYDFCMLILVGEASLPTKYKAVKRARRS